MRRSPHTHSHEPVNTQRHTTPTRAHANTRTGHTPTHPVSAHRKDDGRTHACRHKPVQTVTALSLSLTHTRTHTHTVCGPQGCMWLHRITYTHTCACTHTQITEHTNTQALPLGMHNCPCKHTHLRLQTHAQHSHKVAGTAIHAWQFTNTHTHTHTTRKNHTRP